MSISITAACLALSNYISTSQPDFKYLTQAGYTFAVLTELSEVTPLKYCKKNIEMMNLDSGNIRNLLVFSHRNDGQCGSNLAKYTEVWNCPKSFQADRLISVLEQKFYLRANSIKCNVLNSSISLIGNDEIPRHINFDFKKYTVKKIEITKLMGEPFYVTGGYMQPVESPCKSQNSDTTSTK